MVVFPIVVACWAGLFHALCAFSLFPSTAIIVLVVVVVIFHERERDGEVFN